MRERLKAVAYDQLLIKQQSNFTCVAVVRHSCAVTGSEMVGDIDGEESEARMEHSGTNKGEVRKRKRRWERKGVGI